MRSIASSARAFVSKSKPSGISCSQRTSFLSFSSPLFSPSFFQHYFSTTANVPLSTLKLNPVHLEALTRKFKIKELYKIQHDVFEPLRAGRDLVGKSKTGTGKTLAFCLPLVERLISEGFRPESRHAGILILEPTRELARQVADCLQNLNRSLNVVVIYGGASYDPQTEGLRRGADVVVATPGRLIDHIERGNIKLKDVKAIVLDEADEMLKMGFQEPVDRIFAETGSSRQVAFFSATVPPWVKRLTVKYATDPITIDATEGESGKTPETIQHLALCTPSDMKDRAEVISSIIRTYATTSGRTLIFASRKDDCNKIASLLSLHAARALHGDISQNIREKTMYAFRRGDCKTLVATDVAARGIDIPEVDIVIHSVFPDDSKSYIHRAGRTGRAGKQGKSIILYEPAQRGDILNLAAALEVEINNIYCPSVHDIKIEPKHVEEVLQLAPVDDSVFQQISPVVAELLKKHDPAKLITQLLADKLSSDLIPRSILTSELNYTTILVTRKGSRGGGVTKTKALELLERVIGDADTGRIELYSDGVAIDISHRLIGKLSSKLQEVNLGDFEISIPRALPVEIFTNAVSSGWADDESQMRRRGSMNRGGFGGSRDFGRGGFSRGRDGFRSGGGFGGRDGFRSGGGFGGRDGFGSGGGFNGRDGLRFGSGSGGRNGGFGGEGGRGGFRSQKSNGDQEGDSFFDDLFGNKQTARVS